MGKGKRYCIIMAGGAGTRFWPISRNSKPKQFLDILGTGKTFLRSTYERFSPMIPDEDFLVVTNSGYRDLVLEQIPELSAQQVLCEPIGRNTAPCIAYAAFRIAATDPESTMIVTPSDHLILNEAKFLGVIGKSAEFVENNRTLMTIGIEPTEPNTGYGYIQVGPNCGGEDDEICPVKTFTEKPGLEMAKTFVESGEFFWNSGIFIWQTDYILEKFSQLLPDLYQLFDSVVPCYGSEGEYDRITNIYPQCRAVSIDIGIMERSDNAYVCCSNFGWSDIGTWGALYRYSDKDASGNVKPQFSALYDTKNCIVKVPEGKLAVIEGLEDYIVVDKDNVLMICPRSNEQNIKKFIEEVRYDNGDRFI